MRLTPTTFNYCLNVLMSTIPVNSLIRAGKKELGLQF